MIDSILKLAVGQPMENLIRTENYVIVSELVDRIIRNEREKLF